MLRAIKLSVAAAILIVIALVCSVGIGCPAGDLSGDCIVDFKDLSAFAQEWLNDSASNADLQPGGGVNLADLAVLANNWNKKSGMAVINEIHYNPDKEVELVEFVELHNPTTVDVNISGWYFSAGISYKFPMPTILLPGTVLRAGGYLVVAEDPSLAVTPVTLTGKYGTSSTLIYKPFVGNLSNDGERIVLRDANGDMVDEVDYQSGFPWPTVGDPVPITQPGKGHSIQLVNPFFDNDLAGSWRSAYPTPGAKNSVYAANIPPHIRQVTHTPKQPKSGETVTITAKVTDPDGVANVTLWFQLVNPGSYISRNDAQYQTNWIDMEMHDDGLNGDEFAGDDIYTVQMPGDLHINRQLVRYRITVVDTGNRSLLVPYADDTQPNFAYFVYDGVPAWRGAIQPGVTPIVEYPAEVMRSIPVYHLISKKTDVETATWREKYAGMDYKWWGTLVYDGEVYDHIRYRMRGGVWRYSMGKNMWKFDFNRAHWFQARDDYGEKYKSQWTKINFSACIQQGSFGQRGEQGMFEAVSFGMFNMAGVPASKTNWVHFRVIDELYEDGTLNASHPPLTGSGTQYDGDFWGLYMNIEQMDGRFLDEHELPSGNLYRLESGTREINNQGPTQVTDYSDLTAFMNGYGSNPVANWWGQKVNLPCYYSYYAIYQAIHHGDITSKNFYYYFNPIPTITQWGTYKLCTQLPWDLDLTWTTYYGGGGVLNDEFSRSNIFSYEVYNVANKNRVREVCDLFFNSDQTNQLIDEFAYIINDPAGGLSIVDADRAMWDYHWVVTDAACSQGYLDQCGAGKAGQGRFYQEAQNRGYERSFEGMIQVMKDFVVERQSYMNDRSADSAIPSTPTVTATCGPNSPANALTFQVSPFSDPQGSGTFGAMKWRIAEVAVGSQGEPPSEDIVLVPEGAKWRYFKGLDEPSVIQGEWRKEDFYDLDWPEAYTPIGYGETWIPTASQLNDMRGYYTTIYVRKKFEVTDLDAIDKLVVDIKYDDGINVWINTKRAAWGNVPGEELAHDATVPNRTENHNFTPVVIDDPASYLNVGTNIVAAQVVNTSLGDSGDCFVDVRLIGKPADPCHLPPPRPTGLGKYEIEAVWESGEITPYNNSIRIPATGIRPGRTYRVRCRMKDNTERWSHWSNPVQFVAGEPLAAGTLENLRITEVMYNPPDPPSPDTTDNDEFEYIELKNTGDEALDLTYVSFVDGITFDFNGSSITSLAPGDFVLVVRNKTAFQSRYGSGLAGKIAGEYKNNAQNNLKNSGDNVKLIDYWNGTIAEFEYGDGRGWPIAADGAGHSLVPLESAVLDEPDGSLNYGGNWRASTYIQGSPGQGDPEPPATVVINEVMAHTDYTDPQHPEYDSNDWIELYNNSASPVNLNSSWYLSDDFDNLKKWAIPAIQLAGHSRIVFDEVTDFHKPISVGFGLNKAGEQVILSYLPGGGQDRIVDCVGFKGQENNISLGRYPDGEVYWFRMVPSKDSANVEPVLEIVINELMYHPQDSNEEYIELYNPTGGAILLQNAQGPWQLDGAVSWTFPSGKSIPAGGRLIVVGFDPVIESSRLDAFKAVYNTGPLVAGVDIIGPWSGDLSNGGERLALERPQAPDVEGDPISWVIVDEVIYGDVAPWPESPDGDGDALQRILVDKYHSGNDPANWKGAAPSPGSNP